MNFHENACETLKIYQIKQNKSIVYMIFIKNLKIRICLVCNRTTEIVWVHGHGQCSFCKTNIDPCCSGETAEREGGSPLNESVGIGSEATELKSL